jgi:hypothetical protein
VSVGMLVSAGIICLTWRLLVCTTLASINSSASLVAMFRLGVLVGPLLPHCVTLDAGTIVAYATAPSSRDFLDKCLWQDAYLNPGRTLDCRKKQTTWDAGPMIEIYSGPPPMRR